MTEKGGAIKNQMVEYAHVALERIPLGGWNESTGMPAYHYRYIVLPYLMHYTRVPMFQKPMSRNDRAELERLYVKRVYDYMYTGKNVDVRRFNLNFNHLFYQAFPYGNSSGIFTDPTRNSSHSQTGKAVPTNTSSGSSKKRTIPASPQMANPELSKINKHGSNAARRNYDSIDALITSMHQAILDNTDMITCELEILGDPYFLVTGGIGNYKPGARDLGTTNNGEAPYQSSDVIIAVNFKTPNDITANGSVEFTKAPFGGCFRVNKVRSKFSDGLFTQQLFLVRLPGQLEDASLSGTTVVSDAEYNKATMLADIAVPAFTEIG
jgi:hypothetical protein